MKRFDRSLPATYFDELYAIDPDPWRFAASPYEALKYAATLEALPRGAYTSALEIGCSIGVLTEQLAPRCRSLLALDVANAALSQASGRCARHDHVAFDKRRVPGDWPAGRFDLILLSEIIYYLDRGDLGRLADRVVASAMLEADIVLVHWLGGTDYPLSGDDAADGFLAALAPATSIVAQRREAKYRIDIVRRTHGAAC